MSFNAAEKKGRDFQIDRWESWRDLATGVWGHEVTKALFSPEPIEFPPPAAVAAEQPKTTAAPARESGMSGTERARRNRQRRAAFQPRGFAPPTLSQPGLLGQ